MDLIPGNPMREIDSDQWFREAFDEYYADLYAHRDSGEAIEFVGLLAERVTLRNALVLDLACGGGRHMVALENVGGRAIGLDLSAALLKRAALEVRGLLVRGDMRQLPLSEGSVDGVISMFTSFGYFSRHDDEMAVLKDIERCLKPGGWFVIDYMNSRLVRRSLEPTSRRQMGELDVMERRSIDEGEQTVVKEIELTDRGHLVRRYTEIVKLLDREELYAMLVEAGLEPSMYFGDYSGAEYQEDESPRLIVFCRKRKGNGH